MFTIHRVSTLPPDFDGLAAAASAEGFNFLRRMQREWQEGVNRFDKQGEAVFVALVNKTLVGICGLNVDPYQADPLIGRVRHLYVAAAYRKQGIGAALMQAVIDTARTRFTVLRLLTPTAEATTFYDHLGFTRVKGEEHVSHFLPLN